MSDLSDAALADLVGGDVASIADAEGVEAVSAADVEAAARAADEAEQRAAASEKAAIAGTAGHGQAVSDREGAKFARLRHQLAVRKHERHLQAERIRGLHARGQAVLEHAGKLPALRDATTADNALIEEAQARKQERFRSWNEELIGLAGEIVALSPHPQRPGGAAHPGSANVWAGVHCTDPEARETAHVVVGGTSVHGIWAQDPDGERHAIDAAVRQIAGRDPSERLMRGPNGVVVPLGRDPGGHLARRAASGELHELDAAERAAYYAGEGA